MLAKKLLFSLFLLLMLFSFNPIYGVRYPGSKHTISHGGHYYNGKGKSHRGGHYRNTRTYNHYGRHKR